MSLSGFGPRSRHSHPPPLPPSPPPRAPSLGASLPASSPSTSTSPSTRTLRNGGPVSISGWLTRGRMPGRRRFFRLQGVMLTHGDSEEEVFADVLVAPAASVAATAAASAAALPESDSGSYHEGRISNASSFSLPPSPRSASARGSLRDSLRELKDVRRESILARRGRPGRKKNSSVERHCLYDTPVEWNKARLVITLPKLRLALYAPDADAWTAWTKAMERASSRKIQDFYTIITSNVLGSGAYGCVREGYEFRTRERVAIKAIEKDRCSLLELEQAQREAAIVMAIDHPNIVHTHDIFETDKWLYIVMELMEDSLEGLLRKRGGCVDEDTAREMFRSIIEAVEAIHDMGVVHRDIKPENVLIRSTASRFHPKLSDFGFGAFVGEEDTELRGTVGTGVYLAPEIVIHANYGRPVDMWACGVTLYEMIAGRPPFDGKSVADLMRCIRDRPLRFDGPVWKEVSPACRDLIAGLLKKSPTARLSATDVLGHPWMLSTEASDASEYGTLDYESVVSSRPLPWDGSEPLSPTSSLGQPRRRPRSPPRESLDPTTDDERLLPTGVLSRRMGFEAARSGNLRIESSPSQTSNKASSRSTTRLHFIRTSLVSDESDQQRPPDEANGLLSKLPIPRALQTRVKGPGIRPDKTKLKDMKFYESGKGSRSFLARPVRAPQSGGNGVPRAPGP